MPRTKKSTKKTAKKAIKATKAITSNKVNFHPVAGHILIQPLKAETQTASGIYLPDTVAEKPQTGKVVAIGDTEITEHGIERKCPVKPGDTIIYKKWGGNEVKFGSEEYIFVKFEDVLAIEK